MPVHSRADMVWCPLAGCMPGDLQAAEEVERAEAAALAAKDHSHHHHYHHHKDSKKHKHKKVPSCRQSLAW